MGKLLVEKFWVSECPAKPRGRATQRGVRSWAQRCAKEAPFWKVLPPAGPEVLWLSRDVGCGYLQSPMWFRNLGERLTRTRKEPPISGVSLAPSTDKAWHHVLWERRNQHPVADNEMQICHWKPILFTFYRLGIWVSDFCDSESYKWSEMLEI